MIILVPANVCDELQARAREAKIEVELMPYGENGMDVQGLDQAVGVLRWVAGKGYAALVEHGPNVRWLHTASAGVDHVLTPAVKNKKDLIVTDSGPAFEIAISEFVLAWMLMVSRGLPQLLAHQKAHEWKAEKQKELYGQTVGVIGLGPIGRGVAARAKAFGMRVLGLRRHQAPAPHVDEVLTGQDGLERLVSESDWIVGAAALTDESRSLLGSEQIAQMKPSVWIVNIARGALIDQDALVDALQHGRIGGACLDVFAKEPLPADSPLWDMPNVYIAPHNSSGWTESLMERQKVIFLNNLRHFTQNESMDGQVDMSRGY